MAAHYKTAPNVIFGLMNEPNAQTPAAWAVAAQGAVNTIRATGAAQEILVSGSDWDGASSWVSSGNAATVGEITDPLNNLVFEAHQYFNPGSTGTSTAVVSPNIGPQSLAAITQWAGANGKKLFLGEFGAGSDPASLTALGNTLNYLNANATVWQGGTYWAGGPWMGDYMFSADPQNGVEAPQTAVLAAAAAPAQSLTIYSAKTVIVATDTASASPFSGVIITGADAAQSMTATVTLSSGLYGTLSDPNAATDGGKIVNGVWTMSGSSAAVAAALDGLAFTPNANLIGTPGAATTIATAVIGDGDETATTTSTITAGTPLPVAITPATRTIATTDAASVAPFARMEITDANAGQSETAAVTVGVGANGTLSDPNATTDGSVVANGVLTVSGSASAVAAALHRLVFTTTANEVAPDAAVATTMTATVTDSAGEMASAASTIVATQAPAASPTAETIALNLSEDYADGAPTFTVEVDGQQVGGDYQAHALHASGDAGTVTLTGNWGSGVNDVEVNFINHAYGRNLYVNSISENGVTYAGTSAAFPRNGSHTFAIGGTTPTETAPADTLTVQLSEDAWAGNALFALYIDGHAVTTPQVVSALHDASQTQGFTFAGSWGAGTHTIGIACVNNAYGPRAGEQRNLFIDGLTVDGSDVFSGLSAQHVTNGIASFTVATAH
jgi:aryl-phospho-beta-D-glucosidase BglC (GH1 family)